MKKTIRKHMKRFSQDITKTMQVTLTAAFGLISANAWKEVLEIWLVNIQALSPIQSKVIIAFLITFISAISIFIFSKLTK